MVANIHQPSTRNRIVGSQLRRLREARQMKIEDAILAIPSVNRTAAYRHESGKAEVKPHEAVSYIHVYEATKTPAADLILGLTRGPDFGAWDEERGPRTGQSEIADLEGIADRIDQYDPITISGLLQTEEFTQALFDSARELLIAEGVDIERVAALREERKKVLYDESKEKNFILLESTLRFSAGGPDVVRRQAQHIVHLIENHGVNVQIYPFGQPCPVLNLSALLVSINTGTEPVKIAHTEDTNFGQLVDESAQAMRVERAITMMSERCLNSEETVRALENAYV